jgi:hypothetical protein
MSMSLCEAACSSPRGTARALCVTLQTFGVLENILTACCIMLIYTGHLCGRAMP